jgi:hypothetical protein
MVTWLWTSTYLDNKKGAVFNATLNNISVISRQSVLLVEETGGPEKTIDLSKVTDKLCYITRWWEQVPKSVVIFSGREQVPLFKQRKICKDWFYHCSNYI